MTLNQHTLLTSCSWLVMGGMILALPLSAQTRITATSDNAGPIRIDLIRWSNDMERDQLISAWTKPVLPGRGTARAVDPFGAGNDPQAGAAAAEGRGGARGGRAGRGGGRGGDAPAEATRATPEGSLKAALDKVPTVGYLWSSEVAGYAIHYAAKLPSADGGERIILITDRRLGDSDNIWKPSGGPANYEFSLLELHLNSKGEGEGKASLSGKVTADSAAKTLALEEYAPLPVVLKNVKLSASRP